jgi:hypothetical protein
VFFGSFDELATVRVGVFFASAMAADAIGSVFVTTEATATGASDCLVGAGTIALEEFLVELEEVGTDAKMPGEVEATGPLALLPIRQTIAPAATVTTSAAPMVSGTRRRKRASLRE